jgi:hypothetical protein
MHAASFALTFHSTQESAFCIQEGDIGCIPTQTELPTSAKKAEPSFCKTSWKSSEPDTFLQVSLSLVQTNEPFTLRHRSLFAPSSQDWTPVNPSVCNIKMSSPTRGSSMMTKKMVVAMSTKAPIEHRDIRESFASSDPQDTKHLTSSAPQASLPHPTQSSPVTSSEDPNTLISITQHHLPTDTTQSLASPSRLTRQRVKEQREQESKLPSVGTPTPPTSTGAKRSSSPIQHPIIDNVTARWRRLTRGIPSPQEPAESRITERKSRKLASSDSTMTTPFGVSGQKAVTSTPVGGKEDCSNQDGQNETMALDQIESKSSTSRTRTRKTATRDQR